MDCSITDSPKKPRGRARKSLQNSLNLSHMMESDQTMDLSFKRKYPTKGYEVDNDFDITICDKIPTPSKKIKMDELPTKSRCTVQPTRLQPHRAARYTESYSGTSSPDVVVLSDDENKHNGDCNGLNSDSGDSLSGLLALPPIKSLTKEEALEMECELQELRRKLLNEEMKLVLLKKLQQSQLLKSPHPELNKPLIPLRGQHNQQMIYSTNRSSPTDMGTSSPNKQLAPMNKHILHRAQFLKAHNKDVQSQLPRVQNTFTPLNQKKVLKTTTSTTPATITASNPLRYPPKAHSSQKNDPILIPSQVTVSLVSQSPSPLPTPQQEKVNTESSAQRQAAAKLALRKQLEKTLLQIPPPKPPPPQLNFIPNASSPEFICLIGLELVVDFLTKTKFSVSVPKETFICSQCSTDFTASWKCREKEKRGKRELRVICEMCVTSNIRKTVKAEHTNRLKTAFVKALQQEQEIERLAKIAPSALSFTLVPNCSSNSSGNSSSIRHSSNTSLSSFSRSGSSNNIYPNKSGVVMQQPKLTSQRQSLIQVQAQNLLAQGIPLPAHMLPFASLVSQYPYQLLGKGSLPQVDMQRQYLLDMIPKCSLPQGSVNWKT